VIPSRIARSFADLPKELIDLCRPHAWADLTRPPAPGMRPIRDILVHMMAAEARWIGRAMGGRPDPDYQPEDFRDLDAILTVWGPQRRETVQFIQGLTPDQSRAAVPIPGDETKTTAADIVWHIVTHDQYHRGQLFTRLALLGRRDLPDYDMLR
jgi:uncharacterized damage-inducible protein DinB